MAGVNVERLINEPSAAALYNQITNENKDGCIMVIDFGGGTLDVCPFSLGVGARHSINDTTIYMETIIPRSSMLPCIKEKMFYTLYDGQKALNFKIYQGEQYYVDNNLELGEITVGVNPDEV